jgi:hypothetical protein
MREQWRFHQTGSAIIQALNAWARLEDKDSVRAIPKVEYGHVLPRPETPRQDTFVGHEG